MKKENSTLVKKLKQYSAITAPMIALAGVANAQVIYTDISDVTLSTPGDSYDLDLNNDGNVDFVLQLQTNTSFQRAGIAPYPLSTGNPNAILGTYYFANPAIFPYPALLAQGDPINAAQPQFNLASIAFTVSSNLVYIQPAFLSIYNGSTYGKWQGGVTDGYVGLKFTDGTDNFFGWARCDVNDVATQIVIKDYAYNTNPDQALFAGQGDPAGIGTVNQSSSFNVFGFEGVANVFVNDGKFDGTTVTITNMLGQTMVNQVLNNRSSRFDLNQFGKGIYMVTVQRGDEVFSKKVSFR
jgi:hypothetical protein